MSTTPWLQWVSDNSEITLEVPKTKSLSAQFKWEEHITIWEGHMCMLPWEGYSHGTCHPPWEGHFLAMPPAMGRDMGGALPRHAMGVVAAWRGALQERNEYKAGKRGHQD